MADDVIKRLLIKLGIDRSEFDNATKEIKRTMDILYQAERAKSAQKKADAQSSAAALQAQLVAEKALKDATDVHLGKLNQVAKIRGKELDEMKAAIAQERIRLDAKSQVLRVMQQQGEVQGQSLRSLQQEVSLERSNLAIKQAQLRAAITASSADRRQGFAGGLLEGFSSRLAGTIGFSVLSAEGLGRIFEMAYVKVKELGRALMEATGPAQALRKEFEFLATGKGINPTQLVDQLRNATRNLVSDQKLLEAGTSFLRSNAKITSSQFVELTENVTKLARASGHDVTASLQALQRTLQTGRGYTLAYALGLTNIRELMVRGIPEGASETTRATLSVNQVMNALAREAQKVIVPATTLPELFQQMHIQSENFIEGIAQGMTRTSSFQEAINNISNKLRDMQPWLEKTATRIGKDLANALKFVTDHATALKATFLALTGVLIADWVVINTSRWKAWGDVIGWVATKLGLVKKAEEALIALQVTEKIVGTPTSPVGAMENVASSAVGGIPGISPGISKLLNTGKGGLAYGARSAQLAGRAAQGAEEGGLFGGLEGLGELGVINVGAESTAGAGVGSMVGAAAGGGALATAGIVAGVLATAAAVTAALMAKNKATMRDMFDGVKELGSEIKDTLKSAWEVVFEYVKPKWDATISFIKHGFSEIGSWIGQVNQLSKPSTGKTIWEIIKEQTYQAIANMSPLTQGMDVLIGQLKQLAEYGRSKQYMEGAMASQRHVGVTGAAATEETRSEQNRAKAISKTVPELNLTLDKELQQQRLKLAEETAKARFEIIKEELDNEESALKAKYEIGLVDLTNYISQEKVLRKKELDARLQEIETNREAQIRQVRANAQTVQTGADGKQTFQLEDPSLTKGKIAAINVQARSQSIQAEAQYQKQLAELLYQRLQDEMAAQKTYEEEVLKLRKSAIAEQTKALESHFKSGEVGAEQYIQKRKELIIQERDVVLASLQQELQDSKQTDAEKAKFTIQMVETRIAAERQLAELEQQQEAVRLQATENRYKKELEFNTALQQIAALNTQKGAPGASGQNIALLGQAQNMDEQQLNLLTQLLAKTKEGSAEWFQIVKDIGDVNARLTDTNRKLQEAKDIATPLANIFDHIAAAFNIKWLSNLSQGLKQLTEAGKAIQASGGIRGLAGSFTQLFHRGGAKVPKAPKSSQEVADEDAKKFGEAANTAAKDLQSLAASSKTTATKLQSDWQKAIESLNTKLQGAADSFISGVVNTMKPFTDAVNTATAALQRLANSGGSKQSQAAGLSVPGESVDVNATVPDVPTEDSGVNNLTLDDSSGGSGGSDLGSTSNAAAGAIGSLADAATKGASGFSQFAGKMGDFLGKLGGYAQGISGFIQGISGAKNTGQGIASGAMGGLQFGSQFGPWGAAIGAAVGATIGGIVGHKEAIAQADAKAIQTRLEQIKDSLANNTMTMGQAISQLQALRSSVVTDMRATGKKGSKAGLPQELQAINDQINQLMEQQKKILTDLGNQLAILLEPAPFQEILNNLDQIIAKYQEFASAASGNSAEMAQANQWLVASLSAYATTMANNVRSANEQAIGDAEKLIDLQDQLNQEQLQEYDILTSGVMGRQRTQAQQKGSQIEQVEQQKQQTQSEFDLQKYKVDAESKMFNLANSRLGLEQQMTQLQEKDFDLWAAQVMAMQKTLAQLQSALGAGGTLPAGLLNATGGVNIQSIEQLLGLPITATGQAGVGQAYIQNEPPIYQEFADIISKIPSESNFATDLLAAAQTPFRSSQRQALLNELNSNNFAAFHALKNAGVITNKNDPNWLNFFGWIMNKAQAVNPNQSQGTVPTPTLPGFEMGGMVNQEGPAYLHAGEFVLPSPVVSFIKKAISNVRTSIQGFQEGGGIKPTPVLGGIYNANGHVDAHKTILDLASIRIGMEHDLLSAQRGQTLLEMNRMSQMSDLLSQMYKYQGSGVTSMESAFAKVYELRGRYGSAGFRRETL